MTPADAAAAVSGRRVLVIGLAPYRVPGPWDPGPVATAIEAGMAELAGHGVDAESCLVGLDGIDDIEGQVTEALQQRRWDCVVVGGGIRASADLLELFESVVNLVRRHARRRRSRSTAPRPTSKARSPVGFAEVRRQAW